MTSILKVDTIQNSTGTDALSIGADGTVTRSSIPAFTATGNTNNFQTSTGTLQFDETHVNNGNHYDTSTYTFTAPVAGLYMFSFMLLIEGNVNRVFLQKNGSNLYEIGHTYLSASGEYNRNGGGVVMALVSGDQIRLSLTDNASGGGVYVGESATPYFSWWSGYLIG